MKRWIWGGWLWTCSLSALPSAPEIIHGEASCSEEAQALEITASDRSILHFQTFDVGKGERVRFIQPSEDACVLNRIVGGKPSEIFGRLEANGNVFLVNPEGIYFGPDSSVHVGSLIASSLNIRDEDFLAGNYRFFKEENSAGSVVCEGTISAENFVALLGPVVQNRGRIVADADKVVIGSGEKITLDFTGDGLIQFLVEGALEKALIENYGAIAGRGVELTLRVARKAMQTVVNTEGIEVAAAIEESNGVVRLVSGSQIIADRVVVEGEAVEVRGTIAAEGGTIEVLGDRVDVAGADLDVSGDWGGGTILLGGDYQGGGRRQAEFVSVDPFSCARADARVRGDGGKVIVWADDTTLFDGKIYARGGSLGGNGGFVETSGKEDLGISVGHVDTSAPLGQFGMWLLDPNTITIATGGGASIAQCSAPNCSDNPGRTIAPATIAASATNVALCAQRNANSSITVTNAVTMNNAGVSLTLTAGSANAGTINLNANITTRGAAIGLTGVVVVGANVALDTTNAGGSPGGGNISFSSTVNGSGSRTLTCTGGTGGTVTFTGAVGGTTPLASITATGATITQSSTAVATGAISYTGTSAINVGGTVTTSGAAITMTGPVVLTDTPTFDSTNAGGTAAGATITFSSTVNGAVPLTIRAGTGGTAAFNGAVGGTNALTNLSFTSANLIQVGSDITVTGANALTFPSPVSLTGSGTRTITSNGANINFNSTLNGGQNLTLAAGAGSITFTGAVGGGTRLGTLAITSAANVTSDGITAAAISQAAGTGTTSLGVLDTNGAGGIALTTNAVTLTGNVTTAGGGPLTVTNAGLLTINNGLSLSLAGAFTQNGAGSVSLGGSITTSNLNISFLRAVSLTTGVTLSTGALGVGDITFSGALSGTQTLGLTAGTGNITFGGVVGAPALGAVTINSASNVTATTFSAATLTQSAGSGTSTFNGVVTLSGALALTSSNVTINQNVTSGSSAAISVGSTFALTSGAAMSLDSTFTQSGAGSNQLFGSITTTNDTIQFAGAVVLTGATQLNTGAGVGDITFTSAVQGPGALTLTAGTGNVSFGADSGATTRLGALSIVSSSTISMSAMTAASISAASTGGITLSGALNTSAVGGISFSGAAISLSGGVTTTNSGPVAFTNTGTLTLGNGLSITASGGFSQLGGGGVSTGSAVTAASIAWTNAITLTADSAWSTQAAGGNISVSSTVNGGKALTLSAGTGDITLSAAVGGSTRLTSVTINSARNVTATDIKGGFISQLSGTGTSTFNGALNANTTTGISLIGTNVTISATGSMATITAAGPISVQNSGAFTLAAGATVTSTAGFTQAGGVGTVSLAGSITAASLVSFSSPVTLSGTPSIDTSTAGAGISFLNTVDGVSAGSGALTLTAGVGNILFQGAVGGTLRMGALSLSGAQVSLQAVTARSISSTATAATTVNGALDTNAIGGISLQGTSISLAGNANATASGPIELVNSGTLTINNGLTLSSSGAFSQSGGGAVSLGASVTTSNADLTFTNPITLTAEVALSTGSTGAGNISIGDTVDGAQNFSLTSGTGDITLSGALGGTTRLGAVDFGTAHDISMGNITANSIISSNSTGTFALVGNFNTNGPSGIQKTGNNFSRTGNITTTNGGPLILNNTGTLSTVVTNTTSIDGGYFQIGSGAVHLAGTITTVNTPISFAGPVTLTDTVTLNTSSGAGTITFGNTVIGTQTLDLTAGTGDILFQQAVGTGTALGAVTIHSATNVTTSSTFAASSITASGVSGTVTLGGAVSTSGNISLSANAYAVQAGITTSSGGTLSFALTGSSALTIANGANFSLDGAFAQTGTGSISTGGNITTTNDNISFASPVTLTQNVALSTGAGAGNITFSGAVNGAFALSLTAGTGNLVLNSSIGATTPLTGLTIVSGTALTTARPIVIAGAFTSTVSGATTFNNTVQTTTLSGMNLTGAAFNLNASLSTTNGGPIAIDNSGTLAISAPISSSGAFSQTNTGGVTLGANVTSVGNLSFHAAVSLSINSALNSGNGNITFDGTINGGQELDLTAGSGSITLTGIVGGGTPLSQLKIISAANVTASAAVSAALVTQTAGSGLTWFKDTLSTTDISGISLTGTQFQFDKAVDTGLANGGITLIHTGALTVPSTASLTANGSFAESGGGGVNLGGNVTATNGSMNWGGAITLTHDVTLDTHTGGGNLTLSNTVNGDFCLTLTAGTGTVSLGNALVLHCLSATGANIIQNGAITAATTVAETGAIQLGGNITTTNSNATLTGNVTRTNTNNVTISTGSGAISITGSINGNAAGRNLTLSSTGAVSVGGTIGATVPLTDCSLSGGTISLQNIGTSGAAGVSGTLTLNAGSTATFHGTNYFAGTQSYTAATSFSFAAGSATTVSSNNKAIIFTTGTIALSDLTPLTVNSNGGNITLSDLTGDGLDLTVNANVGTLTYANIGTALTPLNTVDLTAGTFVGTPANIHANTVNFNSPGIITISSSVSSPGAALIYNAPVVVTADNITFSTCDGGGMGGDITFNSTLDADSSTNRNIIIDPCGEQVFFNAPVGGITPFSSITIQPASNVQVNEGLHTGSLTQTGGTGTTILAGGITASAAGGISIQTSAITASDTIATLAGGPLVFSNSGTLTSTASYLLDGAFSQSGAGGVSIGGSIATTDDAISFHGAVSLTSALSLNTVSSTGANITFGSTIGQAQNVNITAGSGTVTVTGAIGSGLARIGTLTINSGTLIAAAVNAAAIVQTAGSATFSGAVNTNTVAGISLTGSQFTFNNTVTTTALGPFSVANTGLLTLAGNCTIAGAFSQTGSGLNRIASQITAANGITFTTGVTLTGASTFDTSANQTPINLSSVDGGFDFTLKAGSLGEITVLSDIGSTARLGALSIVSAEDFVAKNIKAGSLSATNTAVQTTTLGIDTTGNVSMAGGAFDIQGTLTVGGSMTINNSDLFNLVAGSSSAITSFFNQSGTGAVNLAGTIATTNAAITFNGAVTLTGAATSLSSSGGAITFASTVGGAQNLTLTAGAGNVEFQSTVGATGRLATLRIQSAADVSYDSSVSAGAIIQAASSGTTTIGGAMNANTSTGISLTGTIISQNSTLTTTNSGPIAIVNSGALTLAANITADGGFSQSGGGAVSWQGTISTTGDTVSFANGVNLTGAGVVTTAGGDITFSSAVDGTQNLTLTGGLGTITLGANVGTGTRLATLTINSIGTLSTQGVRATQLNKNGATGTSTWSGAIDVSGLNGITVMGGSLNFSGNITTALGGFTLLNSSASSLTGTTISLAGALSQTGTGQVTLSSQITAGGAVNFSGPVIASGSPSVSTALAGQPIQFLNTVDGTGNLTLASGINDITFIAAVGGTTARLGNLVISSARNLTTQAVTAASIVQSAGSSSSVFNGAIDTNGASGVQITSGAVTFGSDVAASGGAIAIVNSGTLTTAIGKTISSAGTFSQSGGGGVSLGGTVVTTNANLSFANAISLTGAASLSTGTGAGNITLSSTVDGGQDFTLTAGTGDITFSAALGGTTRLGAVTFVSGNNITMRDITATSIALTNCTGTFSLGTSLLTGNFNTNGVAGIQVAGNNFFRHGNLVTTNGGPLIVTNTGSITGTGSNTTSISGPYIQNGTGPVNLAGTVTTVNQPISFTGPITLVADSTLDSGSGTGTITLSNTVGGNFDLTLKAGVGNVTLSSDVSTGAFEVTSCTNFTSKAITATSISLDNASGTSTFNGALTTTGTTGVVLTGGAFNCNGNITASGSGGMTLTNAATSTFSPSIAISLGGAFSQVGPNILSMGGSITTSNQDITFQGQLALTGNLTLNSGSGAGNVTIGTELDGTYALTVAAGTGNFTCQAIVGDHAALTNFTVTSATDITLSAIGTSSAAGVTGTVNLTSTDLIAFDGFYYNAANQVYSTPNDFDMQTGSRVTLISTGPITMTAGNIHLNSGTDLYVQTGGGSFSFSNLRGTTHENLIVDTGSGAVSTGPIDTTSAINTVQISGGNITFGGEIQAVNTTFTATGSIANSGSPVDIQSTNTATFNALGGNVGSASSPILVHTSNQIYAGSTYLADFNGSSGDNTVNAISTNPPCIIIFNGVTIQDCGRRPPTPSSLSPLEQIIALTGSRGFVYPEAESSSFNLASDFFFLFDWLDDSYFLSPHTHWLYVSRL